MTEIYKSLKNYHTVSFIGLCKNAGKTTAMNSFLAGLRDDGIPAGVTSVGRDGESTDIVTGTAKPGIQVAAGMLFATAAELLPLCDCTREILEVTDFRTPLGEVALIRALSDGAVQLAGPSTIQQQIELKKVFQNYGAGRIVIDGAASRKSLCTRELADASVLSTGASLNRDMKLVVEQTAFAAELLTLEVTACGDAFSAAENCPERGMVLIGSEAVPIPAGAAPEIALRQNAENRTRSIFFDGAMTDAALQGFLTAGPDCADIELIVRDAGKILLGAAAYQKLKLRQCDIRVLNALRLAAVTVNPFSALGVDFEPEAFRRAVAERVSVPVINVREAVV